MFKTVKGYETYMINENGIIINKNGHVMHPVDNDDKGYLRYALEVYDNNGKLLHRDNLFAHRLVAENFIPNPNNLPIVMHKDNDSTHMHVSNLKWGTIQENVQQAVDDRLTRHIHTSRKYVYEVYNNDRTEIYRCNGSKGAAEFLGYKVFPGLGLIKGGNYQGYYVQRTSEKVRPLVSFEESLIKDN